MKPKVIVTDKIRLFTVSGTVGITLFPFIILDPLYKDDSTLINHESIHIAQQRELWVLPFYLLYIYYYLKNRIKGSSHFQAYEDIPFEIEAYNYEDIPEYLSTRKSFHWKHFRL
jgi:hypothetical protein